MAGTTEESRLGRLASTGQGSRSDSGAGAGTMLGALRRVWQVWKRIAKRIGDFQARIFLAVFYFVFFCPFALAVRWGSDPLAIKKGSPKGWQPPPSREGDPMALAKRQF